MSTRRRGWWAAAGLAVALLASAAPAWAWGWQGHQVIGFIAERRLTPQARAAVADLLEGSTLAAVSTWADEIRPQRRETGPWHYINVSVELSPEQAAAAYAAAASQPASQAADAPATPGNVLAAIAHFEAILADPAQPRAARAEALKFLVHFVGDMHQPLHAGDRGDRGGNDLAVTLPAESNGRQPNLHRVWDTDVVLFDLGVGGVEDYAHRLLQQATPAKLAAAEQGGVAVWAVDSWRAARQAYRDARGQPLANGAALDQAYFAAHAPAVRTQLLAGGVRLAVILNRALAAGVPTSGPASAPASVPAAAEPAAVTADPAPPAGDDDPGNLLGDGPRRPTTQPATVPAR